MTAAAVLALYLALVLAATTGVAGHVPALLRSGEACPECGRPHLPGPCAPKVAAAVAAPWYPDPPKPPTPPTESR